MNAQSPEVQPDLSQSSSAGKNLRLPEPDRDNITVLLHNLPKDPVLPWNHYDSPWQSEDDRSLGEGEENATPVEGAEEPEATVETIAPSVEETPEQILDEGMEQENPPKAEISPGERRLGEVLAEELASGEPLAADAALEGVEGSSDTERLRAQRAFEPGFVHLAPDVIPEDAPLEAEGRLETPAETEIVCPPDEPDPQLLSQLG